MTIDPLSATIGISNGLFEFLVKPALEKKKMAAERQGELKDSIDKYYEIFYPRLKKVRTVAYQSGEANLEDIYFPLKIRNTRNNQSHEINTNCHFIFDRCKKILIVDYAGMGKSTISKYIFLRTCENKSALPIFLELRRLKPSKTVVSLLQEDLGEIGSPAKPRILQDLLKNDSVLIILDGFDEIPNDIKDKAIEEIGQLVDRYPKLKYLITTRKDPMVSILPDFEVYTINKLEKNDIEKVLRIYDPKDTSASKILLEIGKIDDPSFHDLIKNPMMLTLLFRAYGYINEIPPKLYMFFDQVYKSLYNGHDLMKGLRRDHYTNLDIDQFQFMLSLIAIRSIKNGPSYDRSTLISLITQAFNQSGKSDQSADSFLKDLLQAVPLMTDEGNEIRWVHKSFQDYFAAYYISYIADEGRNGILQSIFKSERSYQYSNMIEMCFDMKSLPIEEFIIVPMLDSYIKYSKLQSSRGVDKEVYDNTFMQATIYTNCLDEIDVTKINGDKFKELRKRYEKIVIDKLPRKSGSIAYQTVGSAYIGVGNSYNYWILEFIIKVLPTLINEYKKGNLWKNLPIEDLKIEKVFGHTNAHTIDISDIHLALHCLSRRGRKHVLKNYNEDNIKLYKKELSKRIKTSRMEDVF